MIAIIHDEMVRMLNAAVQNHVEELTGIPISPNSVCTTVHWKNNTARWLDTIDFTIEGSVDLNRLTSGELHSSSLNIRRVIFNDPYTIVLWKDGTKTIVKTSEGDNFDRFTGLALCVLKKEFGDIRYRQFKNYADGVVSDAH